MVRTVPSGVGVARSEEQTFTIGNGANGSAVAAIDLGRGYSFIIIKCEDCQFIQAASSLRAQVGYGDADVLCDLYNQNDPATRWSATPLPTGAGVTLAFCLSQGIGIQRLRLILGLNASGGSVVFKVYGIDPTVDD